MAPEITPLIDGSYIVDYGPYSAHIDHHGVDMKNCNKIDQNLVITLSRSDAETFFKAILHCLKESA